MQNDAKGQAVPSIDELRKHAQDIKIANFNRHPFYHLHRKLSWPITKLAYKLGFSANALTFAMIATWALGVIFALTSFDWFSPIALYASFLLDKSDGELARISGVNSRNATYADEIFHFFSIPAVLLAFVVPRGSEFDLYWMIAGSFTFCLLKYERKLHYKFETKLSRIVSTAPEWFVQDDALILILAISLWTQAFDFVVVWAALLAIAVLWRFAKSLNSTDCSGA